MTITEPRVRRARVLIDDTPDPPPHKFRVLIDPTADEDEDSRAVFFATPVGAICRKLMSLQRMRCYCIRAQFHCNQPLGAFIRTELGYRSDLPKSDRDRISKQTKDLIEMMEPDTPPVEPGLSPEQIERIHTVYTNTMIARAPWDKLRADQEAHMRTLAMRLPVAAWVPSVRGFGLLGLAVVVAEVGNIGENRRRPSGVWKRLGLAVIDGLRQSTIPPGLSKEEQKEAWIERGYNGERRGQIWPFLDDNLVKAQYQKQVVLGPYGEHYIRKKVEYLHRYSNEEHGKGHADQAARHYMAKMFLRDLWKEWCRVTPR